MSNFCLNCIKTKKTCCSADYVKFTTLRDAERIAKFLKTDIRNVVVYGQLCEEDKLTELYIKKIHNYYYDLAAADGGKILQLRRRKDGSCPFFLSREGRCKIYKVRPLSCRVFPFWYSDAGKTVIITDHNGLDCDLLNGKCTIHNRKIKSEHRERIFAEFSCTALQLERLLAKLRKEIGEYKKNIGDFVRTNKVRIC